jgi:predicted lipid-binding transport protein (Tim44 family)
VQVVTAGSRSSDRLPDRRVRVNEIMQFLDFGTLFFLIAAVVIFIQLRSVLGRRTGREKPPHDPYSMRVPDESGAASARDNVVALPGRDKAAAENNFEAIDAYAKPGGKLNGQLRDIGSADPTFEPKTFIEGAKMAYEMIVMAFADGDRKTLRNLLSKDVFEGFVQAISEREERGEKIQSSFVGVNKADIVSAEMKGKEAHLVVRIVSELISATLNKTGEVIEGDPETVAEVKDVWTFARDTKSRDPNWKLVATEAED